VELPLNESRFPRFVGNFRRLVVRYDRSDTIYEAFFHVVCFMITLRKVLK
jgi:hypothetical protein